MSDDGTDAPVQTPPTPATRIPWQAKFLSLAVIWGSSFLLMKYGLRWFSPIQIATGRILLGAVTVVGLLQITGGRLPRQRRVWGHLLIVAFLLSSLPFVLFPLGEERISSALAGIGNATTPIATVIATAILIPTERLPVGKVLGVLLGFLGVVVIAQPWEATGQPDLLGFGFTLLAGACYGLGWTWVRRHLSGEHNLGGLVLPAAMLTVASAQMVVVLLTWWLLHRGDHALPWSPVPGAVGGGFAPIAAVVALGVVGTGLAYLFQFDVVRAVGQQVASLVTYLIPVVSVVLGYLVLHERLGQWQILGAVLVLVSAVVVGRPARGRR